MQDEFDPQGLNMSDDMEDDMDDELEGAGMHIEGEDEADSDEEEGEMME